MSRIGKQPVVIPSGVEVKINSQLVEVKGPKGSNSLTVHNAVTIELKDGEVLVAPIKEKDDFMAGTMRSLINNMVVGANEGFSKKLELVGVGYRAQLRGNVLVLSLGYSHPIEFELPEGIKVDLPSQTEIVVSGHDKALVGQVSANIRAYREPEPYKGKGVRYADEHVIRKETKKK